MQLKEEQLKEIKQKLKDHGMTGEIVDKYYINNKHYTRFFELLAFAKKYNIDRSESIISRLYRADIVIRQEIEKLLKPIELEIRTHLMLLLEFEKIKLSDLEFGKFFRDIKNLTNARKKNKFHNTFLFIMKAIVNIKNHKKIETEEWYLSLSHMSFGQIEAFLSLMNEADVQKTIDSQSDKKIILKALEKVVILRNHIAHLNMIFSNKKIEKWNNNFTIKELIVSLWEIGRGNIAVDLSKAINRYSSNVMKKDDIDRGQWKIVINSIKLFLFSSII